MSSSDEETFDMNAGYKNTSTEVNPVKQTRNRRGKNVRKNTEDISNDEFEDGFDDQLIGDDEDVTYLDSLNDYDRELIIQKRHVLREDKKSKIVAERRIAKAKRLDNEAREKADLKSKLDRFQNSDLKELLNKRSKQHKKREDSDEEYVGYAKSNRKNQDDDEDFRGSSEERDDHHVSKRLKSERLGLKNIYDKPSGKPMFSMTSGEPKKDENDRMINSGDWKKVNQICLKRHELLKWSSHLNFDDLIKDCLVMINMNNNNTNIQKKYCICKIKYVKETDEYYNVDNQKDTNKCLVVEIDGFEQDFKIKFVSNADVDEMRLKHWLDDINKRNEKTITQKDIESKLSMIKTNQSQRYTEDTIGEHVRNKLGNLTQPSLGPGKKTQKQLHPQEKLHIVDEQLQTLKMRLFEAHKDGYKMPQGRMSEQERTMHMDRRITDLKTKKQRMDSQIKQLEKDKKKIEYEQRYSTHIDTNNMSTIPTRKTNLLTSDNYGVEKELYKGGLIQTKPLWVIGDSVKKVGDAEQKENHLKLENMKKLLKQNSIDSSFAQYEDNIDVKNQFLKIFKSRELAIDQEINKMDIDFSAWD